MTHTDLLTSTHTDLLTYTHRDANDPSAHRPETLTQKHAKQTPDKPHTIQTSLNGVKPASCIRSLVFSILYWGFFKPSYQVKVVRGKVYFFLNFPPSSNFETGVAGFNPTLRYLPLQGFKLGSIADSATFMDKASSKKVYERNFEIYPANVLNFARCAFPNKNVTFIIEDEGADGFPQVLRVHAKVLSD